MNTSGSCIHQDVKAGCAVAQVQQKALEAQVGLRRRIRHVDGKFTIYDGSGIIF